MKAPFTIGTVGHFGLAVRDPRRSAQWFMRVLGCLSSSSSKMAWQWATTT